MSKRKIKTRNRPTTNPPKPRSLPLVLEAATKVVTPIGRIYKKVDFTGDAYFLAYLAQGDNYSRMAAKNAEGEVYKFSSIENAYAYLLDNDLPF